MVWVEFQLNSTHNPGRDLGWSRVDRKEWYEFRKIKIEFTNLEGYINLGSNYMILMNLSWMFASNTNLENKEKIGNNKNDQYL